MKRLLTILFLICSFGAYSQIQPAPSGTLVPMSTNQAFFRASDSTYYFYNGTNYLWNYFLNKQQADRLYQPINVPSPLAYSLSTGYGLSGSSFNGSVARTFTADTTSVTGLVSKSRLATNLTGYVPKTTTLTINGSTRDLSTNRIWNVGTVLIVTPGYGLTPQTAITSSGGFAVDTLVLDTVYAKPSDIPTNYWTTNTTQTGLTGNKTTSGNITADSLKRTGGTSTEFLKGDGSVTTLGTSAISLGGTTNGLSYSAGNYRLHKVTATTGGVLTTGADTIAGSKTFTSDPIIPDEAYDVAWNGKLEPPTKNAVWDILNSSYVPYIGASSDVNLGANSLRADSLIKSGGTSAQFLKADGTIDNSTYLTTTGSGSGLSGVVLTSTNQTGIAGDKSWTGTQTIANNVDVTYGTTGLAALQATSTNAGGRALAALANSTLEPFVVTQQGSGKLAVFNTTTGGLSDRVSIENNGTIYTRGRIGVYNLSAGTGGTDSVVVHNSSDTELKVVGTTGTGSAVFNSSPSITTPTFTTTATVDAGTNDILLGATSNYGYTSYNGSTSITGMVGVFGGASGDANNLYLQVPSTGILDFRVDNLDAMIVNASGDLTIAGSNATKASGTAWINPSDLRLKMNVGDYSKGLAEVLKIKPKTWYFNKASGFDQTKKHLSPIAQELKLIMPEMVSTYKGKLNGKEQELLQVDASDMTWLLVKAIQEQQAIIEKLNQRITLLEQK